MKNNTKYPETMLIPLRSSEAFFKAWPVVSKDVVSLTDKLGRSDEDLTKVFNDAMAGDLLLWVIFEDGKPVGFVGTRIEVARTARPCRTLFVSYVFKNSRKKNPRLDWKVVDSVLMQHAADMDCQKVSFSTARNADYLTKKAGYSPAYTVFEKEVGR
jgi:hypothetical protein